MKWCYSESKKFNSVSKSSNRNYSYVNEDKFQKYFNNKASKLIKTDADEIENPNQYRSVDS